MNKLIYFIILLIPIFLHSECSDLNQADCLYWSTYCEWNDDVNQCQELGGDGDGESNGPYSFLSISEDQGLRNGPDYRDGVLYYPLNGTPSYKSIVLTPGFGGGSTEMSSWAEFYASHGFIALRIGPNDENNDSHYQRGLGLIDGIETIRNENNRINSPLYGLIDENSYSVSGYSMGGGASHDAAMIDNSIKAVISLNPTVIFEDCNLCPSNSYEGEIYCICLVPEFIDHPVPSLIYAGEIEVNELPEYEGMLGQDIYFNMPELTDKILFEGEGAGHGFASYPYDEVAQYALNWLKYQLLEDETACETLLDVPSTSSQYLTNFACNESLVGDVNNDDLINVIDIISILNLILISEYQSNADMNNDQHINILDVVSVVNIILG